MQFIDTHVHLNLGHYQEDRDAVIERALSVGLIRMVTSGVTVESSFDSLKLADSYPGLMYAGIGVHPQEAGAWTADSAEQLIQMAQHSAVVAIGETGLDYYHDSAPREQQQVVFRSHIAIAKELGLPLIIHVRDQVQQDLAYQDVIAILQAENAAAVGGVMHCFSGDWAFAEAAMAMNFYLAFGGVVTFKNAQNLQHVAAKAPLDKMLLETDCPWLTPMPHRGQRNEPAYVAHVATKIAELQQCPLDEVAQVTTENARLLFRF